MALFKEGRSEPGQKTPEQLQAERKLVEAIGKLAEMGEKHEQTKDGKFGLIEKETDYALSDKEHGLIIKKENVMTTVARTGDFDSMSSMMRIFREGQHVNHCIFECLGSGNVTINEEGDGLLKIIQEITVKKEKERALHDKK